MMIWEQNYDDDDNDDNCQTVYQRDENSSQSHDGAWTVVAAWNPSWSIYNVCKL